MINEVISSKRLELRNWDDRLPRLMVLCFVCLKVSESVIVFLSYNKREKSGLTT